MTTLTFDARGLRTGDSRANDARLARARARRARVARRDGLSVIGWTLPALAVALFLADGGAATFGTFAGCLTGLGVVAGLVATAAMIEQLLLAARIPLVDRTIGHDGALALHAELGRVTVYGLLAHGALIVAGYALDDRVNLVAEFAGLWASTGDFVLAIAAFAGLALVGVTSVAAVRRRWPYEAWYAIHLLSYAAIAASFPHQFSMSAMLAEGTIGRPVWLALWATTAFCLLTFRVVTPLLSSFEHRLRVVALTPTGPDALTIEVAGRHLERLGATGGQWLNWRFWTPRLAWQQHPFSLSAAPTGDRLRITVRNLGAGTDALIAGLRLGTRVGIEGPYGVFTDTARTRDKLVLLGSGIGIAPVRALLESARFAPGDAVVVLRAHTADELYLADEVRALASAKGAAVVALAGPRAPGTWVDADHAGLRLAQLAPWVADADVYACGPDGWMDAVAADARACGVPDEQVHTERFVW